MRLSTFLVIVVIIAIVAAVDILLWVQTAHP